MEVYVFLSGFLMLCFLITISYLLQLYYMGCDIIRNKCDVICDLKNKIKKLENNAKDDLPDSDKEIIWNAEGGYTIVAKGLVLCCECGNSYTISKIVRTKSGSFCHECCSDYIERIKNGKAEAVSVERQD